MGQLHLQGIRVRHCVPENDAAASAGQRQLGLCGSDAARRHEAAPEADAKAAEQTTYECCLASVRFGRALTITTHC